MLTKMLHLDKVNVVIKENKLCKQESIPVGCVLPTFLVPGGGSAHTLCRRTSPDGDHPVNRQTSVKHYLAPNFVCGL